MLDDVQVWRLDSEKPEYSLLGHLDDVNCIDFIRCGDQHYLVSGSKDCTAKVYTRRTMLMLVGEAEMICLLQILLPFRNIRCIIVFEILGWTKFIGKLAITKMPNK